MKAIPTSAYWRIITHSLLIFVFSFCRSAKERQQHERYNTQALAVSGQQSWLQYVDRDSSARYWSVMTDSPFFFHPDMGLWAQGGRVQANEHTIHQHQRQWNTSARDSTQHVEEYDHWESKRSTRQLPWYVSVTAVALLILMVVWRMVFKG
ncbi:hypothetical protein [Sphingobacterium sp. SYP-B4668]|uniref:hypothetical protein n=1 Tax=Sphingobacterium sp. SYP-B4668 TaxID=2996035 RepID=UPI0022DE5990|nr:hypothetical protein [Sphingobacterium sp. SYP-B4668]